MDFQETLKMLKEDPRYQSAKLVAVQLPEGLKRRAEEIAHTLSDKELVFIGDPFWGACDIPPEGKWDLLVQFGHSPIPNLGSFGKVAFLELQEEVQNEIDYNAVGLSSLTLTSNITYSKELPRIKKYLEDHGIKVTLKRGDLRVLYPGQILGCNISAARGDDEGVLFIGEGMFHPLGIALALDRKVIAYNPRTDEYVDMEREKRKFLAQRYSAVDRATSARIFGIIVSSKIGQTRYSLARAAKRLLDRNGKRSFIIVADLIRDEVLVNFPADVYVNTACPRVTIEDYASFSRPLITYYELEMALGVRDKSRYILDEIVKTDEIGSTSFWRGNESSGNNRLH